MSKIIYITLRNFNSPKGGGSIAASQNFHLMPKTLAKLVQEVGEGERIPAGLFIRDAVAIAKEIGQPMVIDHQMGSNDPLDADHSYYGPYFPDGRNAQVKLWSIMKASLPNGWPVREIVPFVAIVKSQLTEYQLQDMGAVECLDIIAKHRSDWSTLIQKFRVELQGFLESKLWEKFMQVLVGEFPELANERREGLFVHMAGTNPENAEEDMQEVYRYAALMREMFKA